MDLCCGFVNSFFNKFEICLASFLLNVIVFLFVSVFLLLLVRPCIIFQSKCVVSVIPNVSLGGQFIYFTPVCV